MSSVFLLSKKEQILKWRELREEIKNLDENEQIQKVVNYWSVAPSKMFAIDWYEPEFPSPWEIINDGYYDNNLIAYMMLQTLVLSGWDENRIQMCYVKSIDNTFEGMILIIDNNYLLNYSYNEILNINDFKEYFRFLRIDNNII